MSLFLAVEYAIVQKVYIVNVHVRCTMYGVKCTSVAYTADSGVQWWKSKKVYIKCTPRILIYIQCSTVMVL